MKLYDAQTEAWPITSSCTKAAFFNGLKIPFVEVPEYAGARNSSQPVWLRKRAEQVLATVAT